MKYSCTLEFSNSGRIAWLRLSGQKESLAEFYVHGPFANVADAAASARTSANATAFAPVIPKVFRAEVFGLAGYEYLNKTEERIEEK